MSIFIPQNNNLWQNEETRRAIRSQAMRDYRRRQREDKERQAAVAVKDPANDRKAPAKSDPRRKKKPAAPKATNLEPEKPSELHPDTSPYGVYTGSRRSSISSRTESIVDESNSLPSVLIRLNDRAVDRIQMFSDFFESHLPFAGPAESTRARYISYLANVPSLDMSSTLLSSAVDALCFAHLGSKRDDTRLVQASQAAYGKVLSSIRQMVAAPSSGHCPASREVVIGIMLCALFEDACPAKQRSKQSNYMTHLWGAQQYIAVCKPSSFNLSQPLDRAVVHNIFQASFWLALARRKALSFDTEDWRAARFTIWPSRSWYHVYELIPGLLEKADTILAKQDVDPQELLELCDELEDVKESIQTSREPELSKKPPMRVQLANEDAFDKAIEEHAFMLTAPTFTSFPKFQDPESGVNHQSLDMVYLLINCTLLRIFHFRPIAAALNRRAPEDIEREGLDLARKLCETMYYFSTLSSLAYADAIKMALGLARSFFVQQGASRETDWCQRCLIATNARIIRVRAIRPPTLCRVGYLPAGLAAAGRYRNQQISDDSPPAVHAP